MENQVDFKLHEQSSGSSPLEIKGVVFKYFSNSSFMERLRFLFCRGRIYIDNDIVFNSEKKLVILNHIKFLKKNG